VYCAAVLAAIVFCGLDETATSAEETATDSSVFRLLPADGADVEVMGFPERFAELSKKFQAGIKENPGTFLGEVLTAKPGEPIAYDPRIGLTKEEFDEYLRLARDLKFVKLASIKLKVRRTDDAIQLDGGDLLPELKRITIKLNDKQMRTPFGNCTKPTEVRASDGQKATGRWNGLQWKMEKLLPPTEVSVMLGKLEDSGRGLLIYRARGFDGLKPKSVLYVLKYELPAAQ
jgi:hypothetical protein